MNFSGSSNYSNPEMMATAPAMVPFSSNGSAAGAYPPSPNPLPMNFSGSSNYSNSEMIATAPAMIPFSSNGSAGAYPPSPNPLPVMFQPMAYGVNDTLPNVQPMPHMDLNNVNHFSFPMPTMNQQQCLSPMENNQVALNMISDQARNDLHVEFMDKCTTFIDNARRKAKRDRKRWSHREYKTVEHLTKDLTRDFAFWADKHNVELLCTWKDIAIEMAKLIEIESKKKPCQRKLKELADMFRTQVLKYLTRENFETSGCLDNFKEFEKTRSLLIYIRLFKNMQMMRFPEHFNITLSNPDQNNEADTSLRGNTVIRNRCKRMESFRPEAHDFDAFVYDLIKSGDSGVLNMYICKDHKPQPQSKKNKPRVVAGLLFYFVCESADAAENLLREFVLFTENGDTEEKRKIYQGMFRKQKSTDSDPAVDQAKRDRLCSGEPWTPEEFENQKSMYHFTLALPGDKTKTSPLPSLEVKPYDHTLKYLHVENTSPFSALSRKSSLDLDAPFVFGS